MAKGRVNWKIPQEKKTKVKILGGVIWNTLRSIATIIHIAFKKTFGIQSKNKAEKTRIKKNRIEENKIRREKIEWLTPIENCATNKNKSCT